MSQIQLNGDGKDWARKIVARHQAGEKTSSFALRSACEVLLQPVPKPIYRPRQATHSDHRTGGTQPHQLTPAEAFYAAELSGASVFGGAVV